MNCVLDRQVKCYQISLSMQGGSRKKHGRYDDYVDLGAGYDETDPFIDNTDAVSVKMCRSIMILFCCI